MKSGSGRASGDGIVVGLRRLVEGSLMGWLDGWPIDDGLGFFAGHRASIRPTKTRPSRVDLQSNELNTYFCLLSRYVPPTQYTVRTSIVQKEHTNITMRTI